MKASDVENLQLARTVANAGSLLVPAKHGRRALDLGRDVHAVLGLVVDRVDLNSTVEYLRQCASTGRACFLSTPNINFVVGAAKDPAFRGSIMRSDLSVADGFPLVLVARWIGVDMPGRVAGADIFERLQAQKRAVAGPPIRLFLFGGPPGVGARAAANINQQGGGFECVGYDEGGWGDVEAMSSPDTIARINSSGAEFLLVALGAKKGQAWIERNRERLKAPVISHLGAVINFAAGTVARSPKWLQNAGLEWAWRIAQEPQLWRRYWNDGRVLAATLATRLVPWWFLDTLNRPVAASRASPNMSLVADAGRSVRVRLDGDWRNATALPPLREALATLLRDGQTVTFDFSAAPSLGSAILGLLCIVDAWQEAPRVVLADTVRDRYVRAAFRAHGAEHLLQDRLLPLGEPSHAAD